MKKIEIQKEVVDEIIRLYNEEMLGSPSIAEKIGINKHIVLRVLKENNIKVGVPGMKFKGGKSVSDKKWYEKNKEKRLNYFSVWQKDNYEYRKKYMNEYRSKNKERIKEVKRIYQKHKKHTNPIYKLICNFRTAIYQVLKENNVTKNGHYFDVLKYTPEELISHLESKFIDGMTWDNYGEWHVDHVKPISSFNIIEIGDDEFMKCWTLKNLQPLWGVENIKKSNKLL